MDQRLTELRNSGAQHESYFMEETSTNRQRRMDYDEDTLNADLLDAFK